MKKDFPGFMPLLKESWQEYKANWLVLAKVFALGTVYCLIAILVAVLLGTVLFFAVPQPYSFYLVGVLVFVAVVISIYLGSWLNLSLSKAAVDVGNGGNPKSAREIYKATRPLVGGYFIVQILAGLLVMSGYLALIIPGIVLAIWFSFSTYTYLVDGKKGFSSLLLSREYIRGYAAVVFFYFVGWGIITGILLNMLPSIIFEELDANWISGLLNLVTSFVITPLTLIFSFNMYKALKEIKGEITVDLSQPRKMKYYLLLAYGLVAMVGVTILAINLIKGLSELSLPTDYNYEEGEWNIPTDSDTIS